MCADGRVFRDDGPGILQLSGLGAWTSCSEISVCGDLKSN